MSIPHSREGLSVDCPGIFLRILDIAAAEYSMGPLATRRLYAQIAAV